MAQLAESNMTLEVARSGPAIFVVRNARPLEFSPLAPSCAASCHKLLVRAADRVNLN
jgi:hypothetical protein